MSAANRFTRWVVPERGQPDHDQRALDRDVQDLGVTAQQIAHQESVRCVTDAVAEHHEATQPGPIVVGVHLSELQAEAFGEVLGTEVVEPGPGGGGGADGVDAELGRLRLAVLDAHPLDVVEDRCGQVVDADQLTHAGMRPVRHATSSLRHVASGRRPQ